MIASAPSLPAAPMTASAPGLPQLLLGHWETDAALDVAAGLACLLYVWGAWRVAKARHAPWRARHTQPAAAAWRVGRARPLRRWPARRTACFLAGAGVVLVALQSGLAAYDDRLLSAHMVQHMLLLLIAPPLLLGGRPLTLALRALHGPRRAALARLLVQLRGLTNPYVALVAFSLALLLSHLTGFFDATLRHPLLHELEHALFLCVGLLFWTPLLGADPLAARRLGGVGRLVYVLAAMPAMAALGAYLNRATNLVYPPYGPPARALGVSALTDQARAGAIMWVGGSVVLTLAGLWMAMAAMSAEERRVRTRELHSSAGGAEGATP